MDVIDRIHQLREERGWSVNNLAMEAGLTQSTLSSMLGRNTPPKLDTLQCICDAFGITLSQFFLQDEEMEVLTAKEKQLLAAYRKLPERKQKALLSVLED